MARDLDAGLDLPLEVVRGLRGVKYAFYLDRETLDPSSSSLTEAPLSPQSSESFCFAVSWFHFLHLFLATGCCHIQNHLALEPPKFASVIGKVKKAVNHPRA